MLDDIKENEVPKAPKNTEQQQVPQTRANVTISTRLSRPLERFYPSLYYLLMIYNGEAECYEEAV